MAAGAAFTGSSSCLVRTGSLLSGPCLTSRGPAYLNFLLLSFAILLFGRALHADD